MNLKLLPLIFVGIIIGMLIIGGLYWFTLRTEPVEGATAKWEQSNHSDWDSESFVHWNEDEPPEIPTYCAKCHSLYGYLDYVGSDGTEAGVVDEAARVGSVVSCNTCHNEAADNKSTVVFPSGVEVEGLTESAVCMDCHQGRESTQSVDETLAGLPSDTVSETLSFINVHYAVAAATLMGDRVDVGYQYEGREYVGRYPHVEDYDTCIECHDPHSTALDPDACAACHSNVVDYEDLKEIRSTTEVDYDGDGNAEEGIAREIETLHEALYAAIQSYAAEVIGTPIVYADSFPYFFTDSNGNGEVDEGEAAFPNRYQSWTPRLVRAAYNYHYEHEDPGSYTHNANYVLQLLYDSLENLSEQVSVEMEGMARPASEY